ncbi:MAG: hypothetical protein V4564_14885 [Pseudomonadota bacterium]
MTALSISRRPQAGSIFRRLAAILALLAMVGMLGLATWHDGMPHVHSATHSASVDLDHHEHAPASAPYMADLLHMAAHAVLQTVNVPAEPKLAEALPPVAVRWAMASSQAAGSIRPDTILRPPRG